MKRSSRIMRAVCTMSAGNLGWPSDAGAIGIEGTIALTRNSEVKHSSITHSSQNAQLRVSVIWHCPPVGIVVSRTMTQDVVILWFSLSKLGGS